MAALALLENGEPIEIDGVVIRTPGLNGKVEIHEPSPAGTRGGMRAAEDALPALLGALRGMRTTEMMTIEFTKTEEVVGVANVDTRSDRHGDPAIEVTVPAPGDDFGQFILATDENGVMSWHVPVLQDNIVDRTRGKGSRTYVIRRHVEEHVESGQARGLIGAVGKKLLKVLVFPIIDPILGAVGKFFVRRWEKRNRPYGLRTFTPADYQSPIGEPIDQDVWKTLSAGKALLFVHGTFSRSYSAFGGLDVDTIDVLFERYGRRVFAFEHPTLAEDPMENVQWFFDRVPPTAKLDLDIICHSRGGLVSRQIARARYPNIAVDRIVFVAAPNAGTILTDARYVGDFIDSYTNILNAFPDNAVTDTLEAIIAVVKQLAVATLDDLQGLQSMLPSGPYLRELTAAIPANPKYFAITSDFEPWQDTPRVLAIADKVLDKVFGVQKNDLVVPTEGVHKFGSGSLIPDASLRIFAPPDPTPVHTRFFQEPQTRLALLEWLPVQPT